MWKVPTSNPPPYGPSTSCPPIRRARARSEQLVFVGKMDDGTPEPWIEGVLRDAVAAGEFDDLPGSGHPLDNLDRYYERASWAKRYLAKQRFDDEVTELARRIRQGIPRLFACTDPDAMETGLSSLTMTSTRSTHGPPRMSLSTVWTWRHCLPLACVAGSRLLIADPARGQ